MNGIAVMVVEDEQILVATNGGYEEPTGGISVNLSSSRLAIGIEEPSFEEDWRSTG
jgi:hypothetical protein